MGNDLAKKVVIESLALVFFPEMKPTLDKNHVVHLFQSTGGGAKVGAKLYAHDHRKDVFKWASELSRQKTNKGFLRASRGLKEAVNGPARVIVIAKINGARVAHYYINLYDVSKREVETMPSTLLTSSNLIVNKRAGYFITRNDSLWLWESCSQSSFNNKNRQVLLVTLTNPERPIYINTFGYANTWQMDPITIVIDSKRWCINSATQS